MTYAYGMKNAPAVGQALPGLPRREAAGGGGSTELNSIFSAPILNQKTAQLDTNGVSYTNWALGFTPSDIRKVVIQIVGLRDSSTEGAVGSTFILPGQNISGYDRVGFAMAPSSNGWFYVWCQVDGFIRFQSAIGYSFIVTATEYDVTVKNHATFTPSTRTETLPFSISNLRNTYVMGNYFFNDFAGPTASANFFPEYSDTLWTAVVGNAIGYLEDAETFRMLGTAPSDRGRFHVIEYEANT